MPGVKHRAKRRLGRLEKSKDIKNIEVYNKLTGQ